MTAEHIGDMLNAIFCCVVIAVLVAERMGALTFVGWGG